MIFLSLSLYEILVTEGEELKQLEEIEERMKKTVNQANERTRKVESLQKLVEMQTILDFSSLENRGGEWGGSEKMKKELDKIQAILDYFHDYHSQESHMILLLWWDPIENLRGKLCVLCLIQKR